MKKMMVVVLVSLASSVSLASEDNKFSMEIKDGKLSEAVELVNGYCKEEIDEISVKKPDEPLSIKFEDVTCQDAEKLLKHYDAGKA